MALSPALTINQLYTAMNQLQLPYIPIPIEKELTSNQQNSRHNQILMTYIDWPLESGMLAKLKLLHVEVTNSRVIIWSHEVNSTTE